MKTLFTIVLLSALASGQITAAQFGHHEHNIPANGWPATTPANAWGTYRTVGDIVSPGNVRWSDIETSDGVYNWANLDSLVNNYVQCASPLGSGCSLVTNHANVDFIYTNFRVPTWAQSDPTQSCASQPTGSCRCRDTSGSGGVNCPAKFSAFVTAFAARYSSTIKYFGIWNEPGNSSGQEFWWGAGTGSIATASTELAALAAIAYPILHAAGITVISPECQGTGAETFFNTNLLPALQTACGATGNTICADILGFHGYVGTNPETEGTLVNSFVTMLSNASISIPIWDTEHSWGLDSALSDTDMQSSWVARHETLFFSRAGAAARTLWYAWSDSTIGTLWNKTTLTIDPPGTAWNQVAAWLTGSTFTNTCSLSGSVYTCTLTRGNSTDGRIMWDNSQTCSGGVCTTSNQSVPTEFTFYKDLTGNRVEIVASTVPVGIKPVFLVTDPVPVVPNATTFASLAPAICPMRFEPRTLTSKPELAGRDPLDSSCGE